MTAAANRGKYAEGKVREHLAKLDTAMANFDFERVLDAHAAGGRFNARTGDFSWWAPEDHGVIEVKEVQHAFRLPYKNYEREKVNRCRKRQLAGGHIFVMVCHMPAKIWRVPPFTIFLQRDPTTPSGSWDLTEFPTYTSVAEALAFTNLSL